MSTEPEKEAIVPPTASDILAAAVSVIGGEPRPGQQQMVDQISSSFESGEHLLIQAGTGTGKSLGYLAPALAHLGANPKNRVLIATATLALQRQLAEKDIPAAIRATVDAGGTGIRSAILKGRNNYACLLKVREQAEDQDSLLGGQELLAGAKNLGAESALGAEVLALREWAEEQLRSKQVADRDDAPTHTARAWSQVSVSVRECLGAQKCPFGDECFVEKSRQAARAAQLVVTNHALLAIDAMHGGTALPEHDAVIIDEAHELVARMTSAATEDLSAALVERAGRRILSYVDDEVALDFLDTADTLLKGLASVPLGQLLDSDNDAIRALELVRDAARAVVSAMAGDSDPEKTQAVSAVKEIFEFSERMAALRSHDVVWISESETLGRQVHAAPLSVSSLLRNRILAERTTVFTSATLSLGGNFDAVARSFGLQPDEAELPWSGTDVGSPFDYRKQGILYVARDLPNPGRDGINQKTLAQVAELVWAAGGRTLGLFASRKAALDAAAWVRRELPAIPVLCQGDAQLSELTRRFVEEPESCLFGTMSLWQGVDVPGDTCRLVIIDKIPFPRPDDPLMQARQRAVAEAGGNGFMAVAATHAALLLAQGAGRLIRRADDKGLVAVLDPRLSTARYGSFLRSSMPDFWTTNDLEVAVGSLRRLAEVGDG